MRRAGLAVVAGLMIVGVACGGDDADAGSGDARDSEARLTIYSGREEEYVEDLYERFTEDTGIELDVRYGDSAELAGTLLEEGDSTPADVFFSQDAGSLGAVAEGGLFSDVPEDLLERVDPRFRSDAGLWVGTSGRARVAAYNTEVLQDSDLPDSIEGFTDPEWKGRIGFPPTNSSFQAFVAAMILTEGAEETRSFLGGLMANEPRSFEDNGATTRAIAAGEIDVGFVNHYYIYEVAAEDGEIPVENHFFTGGDAGALVNTAGVGILSAGDQEVAAEFVDYLTGEVGQTYFPETVWEYPVVDGYEPSEDLPPLGQIESPDIDLSDLGGTLEPALTMLAEVGAL